MQLPADLRVVIAHSGSAALNSAAARDTFSQRIACVELARLLLGRVWPVAATAQSLSRLTPQYLQVRPGEFYRALMRLPTACTRSQLRLLLADESQRLEQLLASHRDVGRYDLRGVALFAIGECVRSLRFAQALEAGDLPAVGAMMKTSHDGDRRVSFSHDGARRRFAVRMDDAALDALASGDADLAGQPGRYGCSTEAIDQLVDLACSCPGVIGAQPSGAGLGGCMMILARRDAVDRLLGRLRREFYRPRGLAFDVDVCRPVAGAGLIAL